MNLCIAIITENFVSPWYPNDLDSFLGGSQECVVLLAQALRSIGHTVDVFMYGPCPCQTVIYNSIRYQDFSKFQPTYQTVILFKINPFKQPLSAGTNVIYWSSDIENKPTLPGIRYYVSLTQYHRLKNNWGLPADISPVIPHGIDMQSLLDNKTEKEADTMLYSSSLDRGFTTLITDWPKIKQNNSKMKLYVTYGFKIAKQISYGLMKVIINNNEESLINECKDLGITYLGNISKNELEKLYWKCQYWVLPLNNEKSELFCFNAIKAQLCGCIPIVNKIGALTETVGDYINYKDFVNNQMKVIRADNTPPIYSWPEVVNKYWKKIIMG